MKKIIFGHTAPLVLAAAYMLLPGATSLDQACTTSGGTVTTSLCCLSESDFPNTCAIGACGCSAENSHEVKVCDCGDKCWDGEKCV
jgi:hypothetical protein